VISTGAERPVAVLMWGVLLFLLFTLLGATVLPAAALPADFLIGRFGLFTTTKAGLRSAFGSQSGGMDWALRVVAPVAWFVLLALALAFAARFALWRYQRFPFHEQRLWPRRSA
jgi:hypothetical protein